MPGDERLEPDGQGGRSGHRDGDEGGLGPRPTPREPGDDQRGHRDDDRQAADRRQRLEDRRQRRRSGRHHVVEHLRVGGREVASLGRTVGEDGEGRRPEEGRGDREEAIGGGAVRRGGAVRARS